MVFLKPDIVFPRSDQSTHRRLNGSLMCGLGIHGTEVSSSSMMFALFHCPPEQKQELLLKLEEEDTSCSFEASFCSWGPRGNRSKMDFETEPMYILNLASY